jgi:hypothetical protein
MMFDVEIKKVWYAVYEGDDGGDGGGDGDGGTGGDGGGTGGGDGSGGSGGGAGGDGGGAGGTNKNFSQEDLNRFLANEKRKWKQQQQKAIDELEALRAKANLTEEERQQYDDRIEQMKNELLTKEQLTQKEREKTEKAYKKELEKLTGERDNWKGRFTEATITRAITDAAVSNDAYVPGQIVAIVRPATQLAEELDGEGKPTGKLVPIVELHDKDKDGKPVTLKLSPKDAVKRMKEMDEYLNLFKGEGTGGLGGMNRGGSAKQTDLKNLAKDPAAYRKARKEGKVNFS